MTSANEFWNWFDKNKSDYYFLQQVTDKKVKEQLLDKFLVELHKYSDGLYFLIGGDEDGPKELIITAEGDPDYFDQVLELTAAAPRFEEWEIIAFKPPQGINFTTSYKEVSLSPREMWFLPLENDDESGIVGLIVAFSHYAPELEEDFLFATYIILDTVLGEKSAFYDLAFVEITQLSSNFINEGYLPLSELEDFIAKMKNNSK